MVHQHTHTYIKKILKDFFGNRWQIIVSISTISHKNKSFALKLLFPQSIETLNNSGSRNIFSYEKMRCKVAFVLTVKISNLFMANLALTDFLKFSGSNSWWTKKATHWCLPVTFLSHSMELHL